MVILIQPKKLLSGGCHFKLLFNQVVVNKLP